MPKAADFIKIKIVPDKVDEPVLKQSMQEYVRAVNETVARMKEYGNAKLYSSKEIDAVIPSSCKVRVALFSFNFVSILMKRKKDALEIRNEALRDKELREICEKVPLECPTCSWNSTGFNIDDDLVVMVKTDQRRRIVSKINIKMEETANERYILNNTKPITLDIVEEPDGYYAKVYYVETQKKKSKEEITEKWKEYGLKHKPRAVSLYDAEAMELSARVKYAGLNNKPGMISAKKEKDIYGIGTIIRYLTAHPVVIVLTDDLTRCSNVQKMDAVELLLKRLHISYSIDGDDMLVPMPEAHFDALCKYYVSDVDLMRKLDNPSGKKKEYSIRLSPDNYTSFEAFLEEGNSARLRNFAFSPVICKYSEQLTNFHVEKKSHAERMKEILSENNIPFTVSRNSFKTNITLDGMELIYSCIYIEQKPIASFKEIQTWIQEKYGIKVNGAYVAEVKRKYNISSRKRDNSTVPKTISKRYEDMIAVIYKSGA